MPLPPAHEKVPAEPSAVFTQWYSQLDEMVGDTFRASQSTMNALQPSHHFSAALDARNHQGHSAQHMLRTKILNYSEGLVVDGGGSYGQGWIFAADV